jgi:predicted DNA binding CopG/RHH family protein
MTRGRNTTPVTIRLPDLLIEEVRKRAKKQGIPYTVLMRHYIQEKCGLQKT